MPRPIHFEIPAESPERAIEFYQTVFGWQFRKWDGPAEYWLIETGRADEPGINGGLVRRRDPSQPCVNTINVVSLDSMLERVAGAGGQCVMPKMAVRGIGWLAYCSDIDGHVFGIMQTDPEAK